MIDTLVYNYFNDNDWYSDKGYSDYLEILTDLFEALKSENKEKSYWYAVGSNQQITNDDNGKFISKAKTAYNKLNGTTNSTDGINDTLREILGPSFPEESEEHNETKSIQKARNPFKREAASEQFIWELFDVDIRYNLTIDCTVSANGFRPYSLREFLRKGFGSLQHNKHLDFYIKRTTCPKPDKIYWKVRNVGDVARQKGQIRGGIYQGDKHKYESTSFYGPHYVECYLIKNNVCVAKDRIDVPIE